ncbi:MULTISPECIES: glycosyltransferase [unclassified Agrococcus]|uniref:glycosyltransferase n=1 Tax=unclassified Agrococcus TaxID=2615065 RepID=UPI00361A7E59
MTAAFGSPLVGNDWSAVPLDGPARSVTVIVAHYAQQRELDRTIAALRRQTHPRHLLEIVVADDGSPTPPVVPDDVILVRQADDGFRLSAVRNLGARSATGDVLCFLDADTAPEPEYVARIAALPSAAPDVVAVGRRRHAAFDAVPVDAPVEVAGPEHELEEPRWLVDAYERSRDLLDADARSYRFAIGAVVACSRWLFDDVGGFDESFTSYGGEDWEWVHRAWSRGAALAHVRSAVAWHDGPDWAGRDEDERRRRKNAETVALARVIGVPGSAPASLAIGPPDVVVHLESAPSPAAAIACVDAVLRAFPTARVVVPDAVHAALAADARLVREPGEGHRVAVRLAVPVLLDERARAAMRAAAASVGVGDLATVMLGEHVTVSAERARHRDRRWGRATRWRSERHGADGILVLDDEPDLGGYLGGWWPPAA